MRRERLTTPSKRISAPAQRSAISQLDLAVAVVAQSAGVMRTAAVGLRTGTDFAPHRRCVMKISLHVESIKPVEEVKL